MPDDHDHRRPKIKQVRKPKRLSRIDLLAELDEIDPSEAGKFAVSDPNIMPSITE